MFNHGVNLPVALSLFSTQFDPAQGGVLIMWQTESEIENLGFIIERFEEENVWVEIASFMTDAELEGQGSTSLRSTYTFLDKEIHGGMTYEYRLVDVSYDGLKAYHYLPAVSIDEFLPFLFSLQQNSPNPFNPTTTISFDLPQQTTLSLEVLDVQGRAVATLLNTDKHPGSYSVQWNGLDQRGIQVSTGVYFCRLSAGNYHETIKMVYLR